MEGSVEPGQVVVIDFPYSGFIGAKRRPALCVGSGNERDVILCQITSRNYSQSQTAVQLAETDFIHQGLSRDSFIRPEKIFTFEVEKICRRVGTVKERILIHVGHRLKHILKRALQE